MDIEFTIFYYDFFTYDFFFVLMIQSIQGSGTNEGTNTAGGSPTTTWTYTSGTDIPYGSPSPTCTTTATQTYKNPVEITTADGKDSWSCYIDDEETKCRTFAYSLVFLFFSFFLFFFFPFFYYYFMKLMFVIL
jgi:hypothetical protein